MSSAKRGIDVRFKKCHPTFEFYRLTFMFYRPTFKFYRHPPFKEQKKDSYTKLCMNPFTLLCRPASTPIYHFT